MYIMMSICPSLCNVLVYQATYSGFHVFPYNDQSLSSSHAPSGGVLSPALENLEYSFRYSFFRKPKLRAFRWSSQPGTQEQNHRNWKSSLTEFFSGSSHPSIFCVLHHLLIDSQCCKVVVMIMYRVVFSSNVPPDFQLQNNKNKFQPTRATF